MRKILYRVLRRRTAHKDIVLYCGYDRDEAVRIYYIYKPEQDKVISIVRQKKDVTPLTLKERVERKKVPVGL